MDRALDSLSSEFKPLIFTVLARLMERQLYMLIVQTGRTLEQHLVNVANGASRVGKSKHLPRELRGVPVGSADDAKADAIDLVPFEVYQLHGPDKLAWKAATPESKAAFAAIGEIGEGLGLRWGGRWSDPHDPGHLEFLFPGERYKDIPPSSAAWAAHGVHAIGQRA